MKASDGTVNDESNELTYRISPTEPPSKAVIEATAEATGSSVVGPTDDEDADVLDPLYEAIDPDALDELFPSTPRGEERPEGRISFVYEGCDVEVHSHGIVMIQQRQDIEAPTDAVD